MRSLVPALLGMVLFAAGCGGSSRRGAPPPAANLPPTLALLGPVLDVTSFRGGTVAVPYVDSDPEGAARTTLLADRDGDPATTGDQVVIAADRPATGIEQTALWTTTGAPAGVYRILGRTTDDAGASVDAVAAGLVTVVDLPAPQRIGGTDQDLFPRVAAFPDGSTAVAAFGGAGPIDLGGIVLGRTGSHTLLLVRHDRDGGIAWAREIVQTPSGAVTGFVRDVAAFPDGSCVVVGMFYGVAATFGAGEAGETTFDRPGVFVARYEASGALRWVRMAEDSTPGRTGTLYRVAAARDGSCVVAGAFAQTLAFDGTTLVSAGGNDVFVASYDGEGALSWVRREGGAGQDTADGVDVADDGSCVVVGRTEAGAAFGSAVVPDAPGREGFVARYGPGGTLEWLRSFGGQSDNDPLGVSLFEDGACVVTGSLRLDATFGAGEPGETTLEAGSGYAARFARAGGLDWAVALEEPSAPHAVAARRDGGSVVVGYHFANGGLHGVLAELDADGAELARRTLDSSVRQVVSDDVDRFEDDSIVVAGYYMGEMTIPPAGPEQALASAGYADIFVAWLSTGG